MSIVISEFFSKIKRKWEKELISEWVKKFVSSGNFL